MTTMSPKVIKKIRQTMLLRWRDEGYRNRLTAAMRATRLDKLPPMTDEQFRAYKKIRRAGATREEALSIALPNTPGPVGAKRGDSDVKVQEG